MAGTLHEKGLSLKHILLIGNGHSHLEVLKKLSQKETSTNQYTLISPEPISYYSGLLPRLIMGDILVDSLIIQSAQYAVSKGVKFINDRLVSFNPEDKVANFASGLALNFDILSIDVGGKPKKIDSEDPFNTVYIKPISEFVLQWHEIQRLCSHGQNPSFVVVGGGPVAVEVATALKIRLNRNKALKAQVHVVTDADRICQQYSEKISQQILKSLQKISIRVHLNEKISKVFPKYLLLKTAEKITFDKVFIALPNDRPDFTKNPVNRKLLLEKNIFAVGDCAQMKDYPNLPKSGVIAVYQGRHLAKNLRKLIQDEDLIDYHPSKHQMNILISSQYGARLVRGPITFEGRLARQLKNYIDLKYMQQFTTSNLKNHRCD